MDLVEGFGNMVDWANRSNRPAAREAVTCRVKWLLEQKTHSMSYMPALRNLNIQRFPSYEHVWFHALIVCIYLPYAAKDAKLSSFLVELGKGKKDLSAVERVIKARFALP